MLMVHDDGVLADTVLDNAVDAVLDALKRRCGDDMIVAESTRQQGARSPLTPVVVWLRAHVPGDTVQATAAQAKGVLHIAASPPGGALRASLGLAAEDIPMWVLLVTDATVDVKTAARTSRAKVCWVVSPSGEPSRTFRQVAGATGPACTGGMRTSSSLTASAGTAAGTEWLREILDRPGVEENTIIGGRLLKCELSSGKILDFASPAHSDGDLIEKMRHLAAFGEKGRSNAFDVLHPTLDLQLDDSWRAHGEAFVTDPPFLVLRSNLAGTVKLEDLGVATADLLALLVEAVAGECRLNVVIGARMSSGKTTLCQALMLKVPHDERIDTIEDTPELRLAHHGIHPFAFERLTRTANADGAGRYTMADHLRSAKRSNTQKLVIGEVRGEGTAAMLDAMSSGLTGCLVTLHSEAGDGAIAKLEAYGTSEGERPEFIHRVLAQAVHLTLWMERTSEGRRIGAVSQIVAHEPTPGAISVGTRELWRRGPEDDFAVPVAAPFGRVRDAYVSAGLGDLVERLERDAADGEPRDPLNGRGD